MTGRRIDYFNDPQAPCATTIVPAVSVAVINDAGQLLMIRRTDNDLWALPGGAQEVGESPAQAAAREVLEETGIQCDVTGLVGVFSDPRNVVKFTSDGEVRQEFSVFFTGRPIGGVVKSSEESREVVWVDLKVIDALNMTPAQRRRVIRFLESNDQPYFE